ncbi:hypothetical protein Tco_1464401, partial [Tanacetum coccineum]
MDMCILHLSQLKNVPVPLDHFPINALTTKVFSFMVKKGKSFSGNVTPLFPSMLAQPTEDEGAVSERPYETQPTLSPPHPSQSSSDRSLLGNEDGLTLQSVYDLCVSLCKQATTQAAQIKDLKSQIKQLKKKAKPGRKFAKSTPTTHTEQVFDDVDVNDAMDYMETDAYMQNGVSTEDQDSTVKPDEGTDKPKVSTDKPKVSTAKPKEVEVSIDKLDKGTAEPKDGTSDESTAPTTVFRDDENIAEFLVSMSQNKAKQKGVEIKDAEDSNRPKATSTRSVLTLKPLPQIDPKDKEVEVSTDKLDEGTAEPKDGTSDESTAPTTVFRDDETIAKFLVSMSQNKAKQKGVEIKDAKDSDRPKATSTRSVLTLKPLPKIDPKDKGKKVLEEEAKSDAESEGVDEAKRKFDQLAKDEEIARKEVPCSTKCRCNQEDTSKVPAEQEVTEQ